MNGLAWIDAATVDEAAQLLGEDARTVVKAGGIDLLDLMKEGLIQPARIVNLRTVAGLDDLHIEADGSLHIGALVTLARIESDTRVRQHFCALAEAAGHAATPQVRNAATLGGNLLQRPRCWYFRNAQFPRDEIVARVRAGEHQYHGIFDTDRTPLVHASTPATALCAFGAIVHLHSTRGERSVALDDFLLPPDATRAMDVAMRADEILTHITVPALPQGAVSAYHKQTERESYDWPVCDVAVVVKLRADRTIDAARVALGWVAPTPRRAKEAEALLGGRKLDEAAARIAARAAVRDARPLERSAYKVPILETVIQRTLLRAMT